MKHLLEILSCMYCIVHCEVKIKWVHLASTAHTPRHFATAGEWVTIEYLWVSVFFFVWFFLGAFFKAYEDWDLLSLCYRDSTVHLSSTTPLLRHLYTFQDTICYNSLSHRAFLNTVLLKHPQTSQQHIKTFYKSNLFYPTSSKLCPSCLIKDNPTTGSC